MCSHMCSLMCSEAVCVFIPSFFDFRGSEGPFSCKEIMTQAQKQIPSHEDPSHVFPHPGGKSRSQTVKHAACTRDGPQSVVSHSSVRQKTKTTNASFR